MTSLYLFIDRLTALRLFAMFTFVVFGPALLYFWASHGCGTMCTNGLVPTHRDHLSLGDALYFSLVTVSTLGYGDIQPLGWSRGLACFQVYAGLLLAGLAIAKITSSSGREFRQVGFQTQGLWLVMNFLASHGAGEEDIVTITHLSFDGKEIRYWGTNYTLKGEQCGGFDSDLRWFSSSRLQFVYSNGDSDVNRFSQGTTTITFDEPSEDGKSWTYSAFAKDANRTRAISFDGYRATENQCARLSKGPAEKRSVIHEFVESFGDRYKDVWITWKP